MRGEKRTKEIHEDELARLKHPEERPTSAIDPTELASLVKTTRAPTDDLAIPVEPPLPNVPRATPADDRVTTAARAAVASEPRAHTPSWSGPTKETAVIVNERPTNDPPPLARTHRARERVERISSASLGMVTVEPPRAQIAPLPEPHALADSAIPEPVRFPRASTRQKTMDETLDETTPIFRRGPSPIAMFLALALPGLLLAIAYALIR